VSVHRVRWREGATDHGEEELGRLVGSSLAGDQRSCLPEPRLRGAEPAHRVTADGDARDDLRDRLDRRGGHDLIAEQPRQQHPRDDLRLVRLERGESAAQRLAAVRRGEPGERDGERRAPDRIADRLQRAARAPPSGSETCRHAAACAASSAERAIGRRAMSGTDASSAAAKALSSRRRPSTSDAARTARRLRRSVAARRPPTVIPASREPGRERQDVGDHGVLQRSVGGDEVARGSHHLAHPACPVLLDRVAHPADHRDPVGSDRSAKRGSGTT
jgi:hypothetical protein